MYGVNYSATYILFHIAEILFYTDVALVDFLSVRHQRNVYDCKITVCFLQGA